MVKPVPPLVGRYQKVDGTFSRTPVILFFMRILLLFITLLLATPKAHAQAQHGMFQKPALSSASGKDRKLVGHYTLQVRRPGQKPIMCGGSIVACEGSYYFYTAKHCFEFEKRFEYSDLIDALDPVREVSFEGSASVKIDLRQQIGTQTKGVAEDLVRVKLPKSSPLVAQALAEDRALNCTNKNLSQFPPDTEVMALGRPGCLRSKNFLLRCTQKDCYRVPNNNSGIGDAMSVGQDCFKESMGGMSGGPVIVKHNGELFFMGNTSRHDFKIPEGSKAKWGPMAFSENHGPWKKAYVGVVDGKKARKVLVP